ncbi:MAG TPA: carbohydrate-binding family 9-like protein, partial [Paludibacter sp.]
MKSLKIKYAPKLDNAEIEDAAGFFELNNVFEYIDMLNWPTQFPYKPSCQFKIARSTNSIFIHFKVIESNIRALYTNDQDPVWEDSCVEFFCKLPEQNTYFNFEFNCIGTCLATVREGRDLNVNPLSKKKMNSIKRVASLGNCTFNEKKGNFEWKLTVEIPFELIDIQSDNLPEMLMANFYKCGDGTSIPHYLSWSHISTDTPDF